MVLVAEEAPAVLLGPARVLVLLPVFGGFPRPSAASGRTSPPRSPHACCALGHRHDGGVDDLPAACDVALGLQDAGRSDQTASRSARPWPASRGTAIASWRRECGPRSRAPESARTTAGRAPDIPACSSERLYERLHTSMLNITIASIGLRPAVLFSRSSGVSTTGLDLGAKALPRHQMIDRFERIAPR